MDDQLRTAFRQVLDDAPPAMSATRALARARAARRWRYATGTAAVALGVVILVVAAAMVIPGGGDRLLGAAAPGTGATSEPPVSNEVLTSGPRYDQGVALLERLLTVVPDGYTAPVDSATYTLAPGVPPGFTPGDIFWPPARTHQVSLAELGDDSGKEWTEWVYSAIVHLERDGGVGGLWVSVQVPYEGDRPAPEPDACITALMSLGGSSDCTEVRVGERSVGVAPYNNGPGTQAAVFRHPDGVMVLIIQNTVAVVHPSDETPLVMGLTEFPLSQEELAALAVDERFHLR